MTSGVVALAAVILITVGAAGTGAQDVPQTPRSITSMRGNVYLAQFDWRATVFLITPQGIIVGDPISVEAARWLRDELARRFPGQGVRYVLHSHHHFDRSPGSAIFAGAETVGHRRFNAELRDRRGSSSYADVAPVNRVFDSRERVTLGGATVELIYTGPGHAADMSALYFPAERILFAVDPPAIDMTPFTFDDYVSPHEVAQWLSAVSTLAIDVIVTGEGRQVDPEAISALAPYLDDLIAAVTAGVADGYSMRRLQSDIVLPAHAGNRHYPARAAHVARIYNGLTLRQWTVSATAALNRISQAAEYCAGYETCAPFERTLPSGSIGGGYSFGRFGLVVEAAAGDQLFASRFSRFYDDIVANRRSRLSGLLRYRVGNPAASGLDVLLGVSRVDSNTRGIDRVKEALAGVGGGGRHDVESRLSTVGYTVGADLSIRVSGRWRIAVPLRLTVSESRELHPGKYDIQAGAGLAYRLTHHVAVKSGRPAPIVIRTQP